MAPDSCRRLRSAALCLLAMASAAHLSACDSGEPEEPVAVLAPANGQYETTGRGLDGQCCGLSLVLVRPNDEGNVGGSGTLFQPNGTGQNRAVPIRGEGIVRESFVEILFGAIGGPALFGVIHIERTPVRPGVYQGRISGEYGTGAVELSLVP